VVGPVDRSHNACCGGERRQLVSGH